MKSKLSQLEVYADLAVGMVSRSSNQIVGLLITIVAIPILSPTEFGIFALASSFVAISRTLLYSATFQYIIQTDKLTEYSSECIVVSSLVALLVTGATLALLFFADPFDSPQLLDFFLILAPSNILSVFSAWQEAQLLRSGKLKGYYGITAATEFVSAFVAIGLLFSGTGLIALAWQIYLRSLLLVIGYRLLSRPVLSDRLSWRNVIEVSRWSLPQYGSMTTGLVSAYGADFIVGAVLSPAATGVFRAANRIVTAVGDVCGQPIRIIALTLFSRRTSKGLKSDDAYVRILALTILLPGTVLMGLAILAPVAIPIAVRPEWNGVEMIVVYLCLGRFFSIVQAVSTPLLIAYGRQNVLFPTQLVFSAILVGGLLFAAQYGVIEAAWAFTISAAIGGLVITCLAFTTAESSKTLAWRSLAPALACALLGNGAALLSLHALLPHTDVIVALAACILMAIVVFGVAAVILRREIASTVAAINKVDP